VEDWLYLRLKSQFVDKRRLTQVNRTEKQLKIYEHGGEESAAFF
jgi:hypothetical protein